MDTFLKGHSYRGVVSKGNQLGRTFGFPTANIAIAPSCPDNFGVYVATVNLPDGRILPGISNVGVKPTIGSDQPLLEVHIFDFADDIYGTEITVSLQERLRAERRFSSLDALKEQLLRDKEVAVAIHAARKNSQSFKNCCN